MLLPSFCECSDVLFMLSKGDMGIRLCLCQNSQAVQEWMVSMSKQKSVLTKYKSYPLPLHFPVLLLSGDSGKDSDIPDNCRHFHDCLEIGICHSGSGIVEFYGEMADFKAGDIIVIPRNIAHAVYPAADIASRWSYIYFSPGELFRNFFPGTWRNYDLSADGILSYKYLFEKENCLFLHEMMDCVIRELTEQKFGYQISVRGLLSSVYIEICRVQDSINKGGGKKVASIRVLNAESPLEIVPALNYIEDNYMQHFSVEFLADLCHWSPSHFRRIFHEVMGTSPLDFVNNTRIAKSCGLLCHTEESIPNISEMVGFQSSSSYHRYFTRIMHITPGEYRKQMSLPPGQLIV